MYHIALLKPVQRYSSIIKSGMLLQLSRNNSAPHSFIGCEALQRRKTLMAHSSAFFSRPQWRRSGSFYDISCKGRHLSGRDLSGHDGALILKHELK